MRITSLFVVFVLAAGLLHAALSPLAQESRKVKAVSDPQKTVTVPDGMVWYDGSPPTRGIRFPPGTYQLEGEDGDYLYFRSSAALEMRMFKDGKMVDARDLTGGIMISKRMLSQIPGAAYIDEREGTKMMIWKLGRSFAQGQGKLWKKSF